MIITDSRRKTNKRENPNEVAKNYNYKNINTHTYKFFLSWLKKKERKKDGDEVCY